MWDEQRSICEIRTDPLWNDRSASWSLFNL